MTKVDQFESVFKSAERVRFDLENIRFTRALVVTDADEAAGRRFLEVVSEYFHKLDPTDSPEWELLHDGLYRSVKELVERVREHRPDLVCTYRNLQLPARDFPHSLGAYVDVLTQATEPPVLLMPRPELDRGLRSPQRIMAITDHLTGQHHLVSVAARVAPHDGTLVLAHIEDEVVFARYLDVISKLPDLDTDIAREQIHDRLLKEASEYIRSCREFLAKARPDLQVDSVVTMGHTLNDIRRLIELHEIELLVLNTKDEDQLAMHGLAYPLTIELRELPMLLL